MTAKIPTSPPGAEEPPPEEHDRQAARLIAEAFRSDADNLRLDRAARYVGPEALLFEHTENNRPTPN